MRRRSKVLFALVSLPVVCVGVAALLLARTTPCPAPRSLALDTSLDTSADAERPSSMLAYRTHCYGGPETLQLERVDIPVPGDSQLLVRVYSASLNPLDWHTLRGDPYIMRSGSGLFQPTGHLVGTDFAGVVDAVGSQVSTFSVGDSVFGGADGALAEYVLVNAHGAVAHMPPGVEFEQAAATPVAALTALQALRDNAKVSRGQRVLINGASGGVGTYAVQIATHMGANVTGVQSTRNLELVSSLGAAHTIDYTRDTFTHDTTRYDAIIDMVGNLPVRALANVLTPTGVLVTVGGESHNAWLGPLVRMVTTVATSPFVAPKLIGFIASLNGSDLRLLADLLGSGAVRSAIDRRFDFANVPDAMTYLEQGRAQGKVMVTVTP